MRRALQVAVGATVIGLMAATMAPRAGSSNSQSVPSGVIAFEGESGLYVRSASGGRPRKIAGTMPGDGNPMWSPDGQMLSFERERQRNWDVWVMETDGSGQRQLTFSRADDDFARWAPHGRSLTFMSSRSGDEDVYAISLETGTARRVAKGGEFPDWGPDGRIIFADEGDLFTIRPYGADRRALTTQPSGSVIGAYVSTSGQMIVFNTEEDDGLFTARIDGSRSRQLTFPRTTDDDNPVWSPDDQWVAFHRGRSTTDVYVIRADGEQEARLTNLGTACCPGWGN